MQTSIISEGVIVGSVQIPGAGKPIIILGETVTGGYRKIATVISADLPLLGQIKPGDAVRFKAVSLDEARQALIGVEEKVQGFKGSGFKGSEVQRFRVQGSEVQGFKGSGFKGSRVQGVSVRVSGRRITKSSYETSWNDE